MAKKSVKNTAKSQKSKATAPATTKGSVKEEKTTAKEQAKKPLVSTKKKIGLTVYFTVVATLALVMGAQILLADVYSTPSVENNGTYNTTQTAENETQNGNVSSGIHRRADKTQNDTTTNNGVQQSNNEAVENQNFMDNSNSQNTLKDNNANYQNSNLDANFANQNDNNSVNNQKMENQIPNNQNQNNNLENPNNSFMFD